MRLGLKKHDNIESTERYHQRNHWRPDHSPIRKGERSILSPVASAQTGLLDVSMLLHWGSKSKKSADHYSEMNWNVFSDWCNEVVFPAIAARRKGQCFFSLVLLTTRTSTKKIGYQTHHRTKTVKATRLINWEDSSKTGLWHTDIIKRKLIYLKKPEQLPSSWLTRFKNGEQVRITSLKLKILFLPFAYADLNPVEMVWRVIERKPAERNVNINLREVETISRLELSTINSAFFDKFYRHSMKEKESIKIWRIMMVRQTSKSFNKQPTIILIGEILQ